MKKETGFIMDYDSSTIDHLGMQLYSSFPPVLAELISNSYDAEAHNVTISIDYIKKVVTVVDDGHGMTHIELNSEFLRIGRNRRQSIYGTYSKNKLRKVTGRKGLGKLSVFGIASQIEVISICESVQNGFIIKYDNLKATKPYRPEPIYEYENTLLGNGTTITIREIKLANLTDIDALALSLSKRFSFYDKDFVVKLVNLNDKREIILDKTDFIDNLDGREFSWVLPSSDLSDKEIEEEIEYLKTQKVHGLIVTKNTPLKSKDKGFYLYARGKLVSENIFFDERSNDHFHSYVTGYIHVDVLDDVDDTDYISTDRQNITWDKSDLPLKIRESLNTIINFIERQWRDKRAQKKEDEIEVSLDKSFYDDLTPIETANINGIKKVLAKNSATESDSKEIIKVLQTVKNLYKFESFQKYVTDLNDKELTVENIKKIADDWSTIEAKELAKIAKGRIEAINNFEKFIKSNASEVQVIQPFLEQFPWILDPRITSFEREKTFSKLLKENFPADRLDIDQKNRRIDFLCNTIGDTLMIIELKRPEIKITDKEIEQAFEYDFFIKSKFGERFKEIKTFLISDRYDMDPMTRSKYESFKRDNKVEIRSYSNLLDEARNYNKHFIQMFELLEETRIKEQGE